MLVNQTQQTPTKSQNILKFSCKIKPSCRIVWNGIELGKCSLEDCICYETFIINNLLILIRFFNYEQYNKDIKMSPSTYRLHSVTLIKVIDVSVVVGI